MRKLKNWVITVSVLSLMLLIYMTDNKWSTLNSFSDFINLVAPLLGVCVLLLIFIFLIFANDGWENFVIMSVFNVILLLALYYLSVDFLLESVWLFPSLALLQIGEMIIYQLTMTFPKLKKAPIIRSVISLGKFEPEPDNKTKEPVEEDSMEDYLEDFEVDDELKVYDDYARLVSSGIMSTLKNNGISDGVKNRFKILFANIDKTNFFNILFRAFALIYKEPKILVFALVEWLFLCFAFILWFGLLDSFFDFIEWIFGAPDTISGWILFMLLLVVIFFSGFYVKAVSYLSGILTGATGAACFLREQRGEPRISSCIDIAIANSHDIRDFKKVNSQVRSSFLQNITWGPDSDNKWEWIGITYYAWQLGSICIAPALFRGRGLRASGKESTEFFRHNIWNILRLHNIFKIFSWSAGVLILFYSLPIIVALPKYLNLDVDQMIVMHNLFWFTVPFFIVVGFLKIFVKPVFIACSSQIYLDYLKSINETTDFLKVPEKNYSKFISSFLLIIVVILFLFFISTIDLSPL